METVLTVDTKPGRRRQCLVVETLVSKNNADPSTAALRKLAGLGIGWDFVEEEALARFHIEAGTGRS